MEIASHEPITSEHRPRDEYRKPRHIRWPDRFGPEDIDWVAEGQRRARIPSSEMWGNCRDCQPMCQEHLAHIRQLLAEPA